MSELPPRDRIARHIPSGKRKGIEEDGTTGIVDSAAFMPRPDWPLGMGLEKYLSVTHVDHFGGDIEQQLTAVTKAMRDRVKRLNQNSRIGILQVEVIHDAAALKPKTLRVRIVNPQEDLSYGGIYGMDLEDDIIAQDLARRVLLYRPRLAEAK